MKIIALADQHGRLPILPEGDILLLAGDLTGCNYTGVRDNTESIWNVWLHNEFREWIGNKKTIATAGNHDTIFDKFPYPSFIYFLIDDIIIANDVSIYCTPWIKYFDGLAFNATEEKLDSIYSAIPNGIDILVSHGPPFGYLDVVKGAHVGSRMLFKHIERAKPKIVICGHIHEQYGNMLMPNGTRIYNVSNVPTVIEV